MAVITISQPAELDLRTDLRLIGLELVATIERCPCQACHALDYRYDVDALARGQAGKPCFVAWRAQPEYDYQTITIRWSNDRGNSDVQAAKLIDGRSKADVYVQSYPSGVAYALASELRACLAADLDCAAHPRTLGGASGQTLRIVCSDCAAVRYVPRVRPRATAPALDGFVFDADFDAAWAENERRPA